MEDEQLERPDSDRVLASAIRFLIDGGEEDAATLLLSCYLDIEEADDQGSFSQSIGLVATLYGPRPAYEAFNQKSKNPMRQQAYAALEACIHQPFSLWNLGAGAHVEAIDPNWRTEFLELLKGRAINNQGSDVGLKAKPLAWHNLKFRSHAEVRVAEALDSADVMFLPNCLARLTTARGRGNREPDFLVCSGGRWGIIEVDGEPFHQIAADDHERDRLFKQYGVRVVEHFNAALCASRPEEVVKRFLALLGQG
jgi:hypothetical protein